MARRNPRTTTRLSWSALLLATLAGCDAGDIETGDLGIEDMKGLAQPDRRIVG
jgi:hypothetical protein